MGGGSFQGLALTMQALDRTRFRPVVVFLNRTVFYNRVRKMGGNTYLVMDPVLSVPWPWWIRKRLERIEDRLHERHSASARTWLDWLYAPSLRRLTRLVCDEGVDFLYTNNQMNQDLCIVRLAERLRLPLVIHLRTVHEERYNAARNRGVAAHVTRYISIVENVRSYWEGLGVPPERNRLIHNGLPRLEVSPLDLAQKFGVPAGAAVVVCVARMVWGKGQDFFAGRVCFVPTTIPTR